VSSSRRAGERALPEGANHDHREPGTKLLGSTRLVHEYAITPEVVAVLQETVSGMYEWQGSPEDLAFLRADGSELMLTIAHEAEGWLTLHESERDELLRRCPEIATCIRWDE
jgi:hypothetical protein